MSSAIIGASSGIGRSLVELHQCRGVDCVVFTRHPEKFEAQTAFKLDLTDSKSSGQVLDRVFAEHADIETIFLVSGTGDMEISPDDQVAEATIDLNCRGFTLAAYHAAKHLEKRGSGKLVAITSVAAIRGGSQSLSYNASKAYQSSLLEGIRCRFARLKIPVRVTEIRAGFVDTAMMKAEKPFWVSSPDRAAKAIYSASLKGKDVAYVLGRWRIIGWLLRMMPTFLYKRIG